MDNSSKIKDLQNLTILYVEDEDGARENLMYYLEHSFKKVYSASDGSIGLELFKNHLSSIDLVISDIYMPKLDGLSMIKEMKKLNPNIVFLLTTAYNNQEYLLEAIELGVLSYIVKPIDIDLLFKKIELAYTNVHEEKNLKQLVKKMTSLKTLDINSFLAALDKTINEISKKNIFKFNDSYIYDFNTKLIQKENEIISLTHQEIKFLEYLIEHKNIMVPYETLIYHISPDNYSIDLLRTVVKSIRKKTYKEIIKNLSGVGYKIENV